MESRYRSSFHAAQTGAVGPHRVRQPPAWTDSGGNPVPTRSFSGTRLRALRIERGLKPERLAMLVDRSVWAVHGYERGIGAPSADVIGALADVLDCAIDDLYERRTSAVAA
jgi:DNA-binding XRE family transcriptional regulator